MKNKKEMGSSMVILLAAAGIIVAVVGVLLYSQQKDGSQPTKVSEALVDDKTNEDNQPMKGNDDKMMKNTDAYQYSGELEDVSGGQASGTAYAKFEDGQYALYVEFSNLPDLPEVEPGFFYEGWVVRKSPNSVISSGALSHNGTMFTNEFTSETDLTDHNFYVLTLEPDDGDPAPAEHILEGTLLEI